MICRTLGACQKYWAKPQYLFGPNRITHYKISVDREEYKRDRLFGVLEQLSIKRAIIYCNSRRKMDWLEHEMTERNINVEINVVISIVIDIDIDINKLVG